MSEKRNENKNMIKDLRNEFNDEKQRGEMLTVMTGKNYDIVDTSLPPNFFEQIIMNEIELSEGFHYDKLNALVQLYLNAIQYYSSVFPEKVRAYQNRLEYLLTQKETLKNLCKMKNEEVKKSKSSTQIRQKAKTGFMVQTKNIKQEDIKNKVNKVINENKSIKEHKKNVKILLNNDVENQNKKWKEKLALKKSKMNSNRPLLRTSCRRFFNTPGPILRKSLNIENKVDISRFEKSGKNMPKYGNIDDDDSEEENKSENNGDEDVLRMFKERHNMNDEKKDSDDEGSIIDDNYDDGLEKIEEDEEEIRKDSEKKLEKHLKQYVEIKKEKRRILIEEIIKKRKEAINLIIKNYMNYSRWLKLHFMYKKSQGYYSIFSSIKNVTNIKIKIYTNKYLSEYLIFPLNYCPFRHCFFIDIKKTKFIYNKIIRFQFIINKKIIIDSYYNSKN